MAVVSSTERKERTDRYLCALCTSLYNTAELTAATSNARVADHGRGGKGSLARMVPSTEGSELKKKLCSVDVSYRFNK